MWAKTFETLIETRAINSAEKLHYLGKYVSGSGLRKYADLLVQCEKAMERISSLEVLNDDQENHKTTSKLPRWAAVRWEDDPSNHETTKDETQAVKSCVLCKGAHELNLCLEFCKKDKGKKRMDRLHYGTKFLKKLK